MPYFGTIGIRNLGDELMLRIAEAAFSENTILPVDARRHFQALLLRIFGRGSDRLLVGGGTLLLSDPLFRTLSSAGARDMSFTTFGTGAHPIRVAHASRSFPMWRDLLRRFEFVGVRGPLTAATLEKLGVISTVTGDPALIFSLRDSPPPATSGVVGMNFGTTSGTAWAAHEPALVGALIRTIRELTACGFEVRLFSVWPPDTRILRRVASHASLTDDRVIYEYRDPRRFLEAVAECSLFVGMKLHATILAICAGLPTLAIRYDPKIDDFLASVDALSESVPTSVLSEDGLAPRIIRLSECSSDVRNRQWRSSRELARTFLDYVDTIGGSSSAVKALIVD
jgi:polysaccharide pyruvyl transferase WcaK-like protein